MDEFSLIIIFRASFGCALIWLDSEIIENSLATYDASASQNIECSRNPDAITRWELSLCQSCFQTLKINIGLYSFVSCLVESLNLLTDGPSSLANPPVPEGPTPSSGSPVLIIPPRC